jgi:hypothetical protein
LRHALGYGDVTRSSSAAAARPNAPRTSRTVLVADADPALERELRAAKYDVKPLPAPSFDSDAAEKVRHFDTYNRSSAGRRVAAIVDALRANPGAALVASGDMALAGLLASAVESPRAAILDVGGFDTSNDEDFVKRLYVPGLRRAGDLQTAAAMYGGTLVIHNAGERFSIAGRDAQRAKLAPRDIVNALKAAPGSRTSAAIRDRSDSSGMRR